MGEADTLGLGEAGVAKPSHNLVGGEMARLGLSLAEHTGEPGLGAADTQGLDETDTAEKFNK